MDLMRSMAVALLMGCAAGAHASDPIPWRVADGGNGHWYQFVAGPSIAGGPNFDAQDALCAAQGGHMVSITTTSEWEFLKTTAPTGGGYWIGLRSPQNCVWSWSSEESVVFAAWGLAACGAGPYPNDCGSANLRASMGNRRDCGWNWDDYPQGMMNFTDYIIEWSADCNGDGIVDFGQCRDGSLPDYNANNIPDCCEAGQACTVGSYAVQWRVEDGGNGHWYAAVRTDSTISWHNASAAAELRGGHLATFAEANEFDTIAGRFKARPELWVQTNWARGPWIGAVQDTTAPDFVEPAGGWRWIDGAPVDATFLSTYGGLNDYPCCEDFLQLGEILYAALVNDVPPGAETVSYLVEWSADCNSDGIVDFGQILDGTFGDTNANSVPDCCEGGGSCVSCNGDVTGNGTIDGVDLAAVLADWGSTGKGEFATDTNSDGVVNAADLAIVLSEWGVCVK